MQAGKAKVIIDTDPGCDDVIAMLLAFSASAEDIEIPLISLTHGNIDVVSCLRNVIALLNIITKEREWRRANHRPEGFDALRACKPIVAIGADGPLADQRIMADFFHGRDGLGDVHTSHPHLSPAETWRALFNLPPKNDAANPIPTTDPPLSDPNIQATAATHASFTPSTEPSHKVMLKVLAENEPGTVTIVAIGPMTNLAIAASEDVETFLRAKEVIVMGGAIDSPGNMSPVAEFNTHADTIAFARLMALTSPTPASTMPPPEPNMPQTPTTKYLPPYPARLPSRLNFTLMPLDITVPHVLSQSAFARATGRLPPGSPLAEWTAAFLRPAFARTSRGGWLTMHDPLAVWYAFHRRPGGRADRAVAAARTLSGVTRAMQAQAVSEAADQGVWTVLRGEDVRVETGGQWARGACIVDRRGADFEVAPEVPGADEMVDTVDLPHDMGSWRQPQRGNRVGRVIGSPFSGGREGEFAELLLSTVFGV